MMYKVSLVTAGLILTLLAACGASQPEAAPVLANTEWVLVSLNGESLIPGTSISLVCPSRSQAQSAMCATTPRRRIVELSQPEGDSIKNTPSSRG